MKQVHPGEAIAVFLLLGALAGCDGSSPSDAAPAPEDPAAPPRTNVSVLAVAPGRLEDTLSLSGALEPWQEVVVSAEIGGTVEALGFDKGDTVDRGRVLARVNGTVARAQLEEAEALLMEAEADYERATELVQREAIPRQVLETATARRQQALARVEQARLRLDRAIIEAPVAGVCLDRPVEEGEVIPPGSRLTTIQVQDPLKAVAGIPESLVPLFRVGGGAAILADAYPGRRFPGRIVYIAPAASPVDRTFRVEVRLLEGSRALRPGMVVRLVLTRRVYEDAVVVPEDVLVQRTDGSVLFVVVDGHAVMRRPAILARSDNRVVIGEGLALGENVVVSGQWDLSDGAPVRVVPE